MDENIYMTIDEVYQQSVHQRAPASPDSSLERDSSATDGCLGNLSKIQIQMLKVIDIELTH